MRPDRRLGTMIGQAVTVRRLAVLFAVIFAFAVSGAVLPTGPVNHHGVATHHAIGGPSPAAAMDCGSSCADECGGKCFASKFYETKSGCQRAGESSLAAKPYPNLDWEHYHCDGLQTLGGNWVYRLYLWDLGNPG
jgi:hypothetical protein